MKALLKLSAGVALVACIACGGSSPQSGSLLVTISGLPASTNASVTVTGPGGFNQTVTATQTLSGLTPGSYTVTANNVTAAPYSYGGIVAGSPATVSSSAQASATVTYAAITGAIQLTITGLPTPGTNASVTVTGPGGYTQTVTASQVLGTLVPGTYTITVNQVRVSGSIVDQAFVGTGGTAAVAAGSTATSAVIYSVLASTGKLWIALSTGFIVGYDSSQLASGGALAPSVTLTTPGSQEAVVFDRANNAWAVNLNGGTAFTGLLTKYTPSQLATTGSPAPAVTIDSPSLAGSIGWAFDASSNAWITNIGSPFTLVKFTPALLATSGTPAADVTISANAGSLNQPVGLAFDGGGNLWVANQGNTGPGNNSVVMFLPGQLSSTGNPTPPVTLTADISGSLNTPIGLAFDSTNNLWVSNHTGNSVVRFTPAERAASGSPTPTVILTSAAFSNPHGMAFDNGGNLWVTNVNVGGTSRTLIKFTPAQIATSGSPVPTTTITGLGTMDLGWCAFSPAPANLPLFQ